MLTCSGACSRVAVSMSSPGAHDPPTVAPGPGRSARHTALLIALLAVFFLQGLLFIVESSQTSDEAAHIVAGYSYLTRGDFRLNPEHPPLIKEIAALPLLALDLAFPEGSLWERAEEWNLGRLFVHENRVPNDIILLTARLPILILSIFLALALYRWSLELFGPRAALLSVALFVLDPTVVAHSSLVTTDLGFTLFLFLAVWSLWRWSCHPTPQRLFLTGLAVGGAFASKFTALWLLPIFALLAALLLFTRGGLPARPWRGSSPVASGSRISMPRVGALIVSGLLVGLVAVGVLILTYAGSGLPHFFVGLDRGLQHSAIGHTAYLRGELSETGWWYYFPYAYLIKTPLGTLALVALSLGALALGRRGTLRAELFLAIPILTIITITCLWKVNIGLRHLLPIYPFLYMSVGRLLSDRSARSRPGRWAARATTAAVLIALSFNTAEAARITPYQLAYFNPLIGGPQNGHRHLLDSNLDWGQAARALRRYMKAENVPMIYCAFSGNSDPWYVGVHYQYVPGSGNLGNPKRRSVRLPETVPRELFAVSAMVRHSTHFTSHDLYDWLDDYEPIAMPGYAYFVYDITGDAMAHAWFANLNLSFGLLDLARFEAHRALAIEPGNRFALAVLEQIRQETGGPSGSSGGDGTP